VECFDSRRQQPFFGSKAVHTFVKGFGSRHRNLESRDPAIDKGDWSERQGIQRFSIGSGCELILQDNALSGLAVHLDQESVIMIRRQKGFERAKARLLHREASQSSDYGCHRLFFLFKLSFCTSASSSLCWLRRPEVERRRHAASEVLKRQHPVEPKRGDAAGRRAAEVHGLGARDDKLRGELVCRQDRQWKH